MLFGAMCSVYVENELSSIKNTIASVIATLTDTFMFDELVRSFFNILAARLDVNNLIKVHESLENDDTIPSSIRFKNIDLICKRESTMRSDEFHALNNEYKEYLNEHKQNMKNFFA